MRYNRSATALQELEQEYGENLNAAPLDLGDPEIATILPSRILTRETSAMRARMDAAPSQRQTKRAIIREWLTGCYTEGDAVFWLVSFQLLKKPARGSAYDLMVTAAEAEFGPVALPEPGSAPVPSASKGDPFRPVTEGGSANG